MITNVASMTLSKAGSMEHAPGERHVFKDVEEDLKLDADRTSPEGAAARGNDSQGVTADMKMQRLFRSIVLLVLALAVPRSVSAAVFLNANIGWNTDWVDRVHDLGWRGLRVGFDPGQTPIDGMESMWAYPLTKPDTHVLVVVWSAEHVRF